MRLMVLTRGLKYLLPKTKASPAVTKWPIQFQNDSDIVSLSQILMDFTRKEQCGRESIGGRIDGTSADKCYDRFPYFLVEIGSNTCLVERAEFKTQSL